MKNVKMKYSAERVKIILKKNFKVKGRNDIKSSNISRKFQWR